MTSFFYVLREVLSIMTTAACCGKPVTRFSEVGVKLFHSKFSQQNIPWEEEEKGLGLCWSLHVPCWEHTRLFCWGLLSLEQRHLCQLDVTAHELKTLSNERFSFTS